MGWGGAPLPLGLAADHLHDSGGGRRRGGRGAGVLHPVARRTRGRGVAFGCAAHKGGQEGAGDEDLKGPEGLVRCDAFEVVGRPGTAFGAGLVVDFWGGCRNGGRLFARLVLLVVVVAVGVVVGPPVMPAGPRRLAGWRGCGPGGRLRGAVSIFGSGGVGCSRLAAGSLGLPFVCGLVLSRRFLLTKLPQFVPFGVGHGGASRLPLHGSSRCLGSPQHRRQSLEGGRGRIQQRRRVQHHRLVWLGNCLRRANWRLRTSPRLGSPRLRVLVRPFAGGAGLRAWVFQVRQREGDDSLVAVVWRENVAGVRMCGRPADGGDAQTQQFLLGLLGRVEAVGREPLRGEGLREVEEDRRRGLVRDQAHARASVAVRVDQVGQGRFETGDPDGGQGPPVGDVSGQGCAYALCHDEADHHRTVERVREHGWGAVTARVE